MNCNDERNCFEAWDEVERAVVGNRLEAIGGIDSDDQRAFRIEDADHREDELQRLGITVIR